MFLEDLTLAHQWSLDDFGRAKLTEIESKAYELEKAPVYPKQEDLYRAWELCPFEHIKVVIVGQDPYHGPQQANGLAFSVQKNVKIPPSLKNIFKEIQNDFPDVKYHHGDLSAWAKQGVFLMNTILTVTEGKPLSHAHVGWQDFTHYTLNRLNQHINPLAFILWGKSAHKLAPVIKDTKHLILTAPHPSPLSAYSGFFGCGHFNKINQFLIETQRSPIDWNLI